MHSQAWRGKWVATFTISKLLMSNSVQLRQLPCAASIMGNGPEGGRDYNALLCAKNRPLAEEIGRSLIASRIVRSYFLEQRSVKA
jgi:hypothetical protein